MIKFSQKNLRILTQTFRETTAFEMILIAVLLFPIFFSSLYSTIERLLPDSNKEPISGQIAFIGSVGLICFIGCGKIIEDISKVTTRKLENLKIAVETFMSDRKISLASYDKILKNLNPNNDNGWNEYFLGQLLSKYPETFCSQKIRNKDGGSYKLGLGLVSKEEEVDEQTDEQEKLEKLRVAVEMFMSDKNISIASYDKLLKNLNPNNNNEWNKGFLRKLESTYPETFCYKKIRNKDGESHKPGLGLISNEQEVDELDEDQ